MSMNHHRSYYAGPARPAPSSPALSRPAAPGREHNWSGTAGTTTGSTLPANVVELYPGARLAQEHSRTVRLMGSEAGMATAEYAIATLAAVGLAGLLVFILRSDEVRGFLLTLIRTALALP
jgi:hypothetical protein